MRKIIYWFTVAVLITTIVFALAFPLANITGGRAGLVRVKGNSMYPRFWDGDFALVIPLKYNEGDTVLAYGVLEGTEDPDDQAGLMVKEYHPGRLTSLYGGNYSETFSVRGKVVGNFRWLWTRRPIMAEVPTSRIEDEQRLKSAFVQKKADRAEEARSQDLITAHPDWRIEPKGATEPLGFGKNRIWSPEIPAGGSVTWKITFGSPRKVGTVKIQIFSASSGVQVTLKINGQPVKFSDPDCDSWYSTAVGEDVRVVELVFKSPQGTSCLLVEFGGIRLLP